MAKNIVTLTDLKLKEEQEKAIMDSFLSVMESSAQPAVASSAMPPPPPNINEADEKAIMDSFAGILDAPTIPRPLTPIPFDISITPVAPELPLPATTVPQMTEDQLRAVGLLGPSTSPTPKKRKETDDKTTNSSLGTSSLSENVSSKQAEHKLGAWCRSVFGSSGVGGSGVRLDDPNLSLEDSGDGDGGGTALKKLKLTADGKVSTVPSVRNELHWHPKQVKLKDKLRDNATAEEFERVLPEYISGGLLSAIYTVYSVFQLNLKLSHFTLKDLILGDNLESMTPKTKQSHYFRLIVIQAFREERFNNSQRMRSVQGAKIQHIITSRLYQNLLHSCGAHYQSS